MPRLRHYLAARIAILVGRDVTTTRTVKIANAFFVLLFAHFEFKINPCLQLEYQKSSSFMMHKYRSLQNSSHSPLY